MFRKGNTMDPLKCIVVVDNTGRIKQRIDLTEAYKTAGPQILKMEVEKMPAIEEVLPEVDPWMLTQTFSPVLDRNVPITPKMRMKPFFGMEFAPADAC